MKKDGRETTVFDSTTSNAEELQKRFWDLLSNSSASGRKSQGIVNKGTVVENKKDKRDLVAGLSRKPMIKGPSLSKIVSKKPVSTYDVLFKDLIGDKNAQCKREYVINPAIFSKDNKREEEKVVLKRYPKSHADKLKQINEEFLRRITPKSSTETSETKKYEKDLDRVPKKEQELRGKREVTESINKPGFERIKSSLRKIRGTSSYNGDSSNFLESDVFSTENKSNSRSISKREWTKRSKNKYDLNIGTSSYGRFPCRTVTLEDRNTGFVVNDKIDKSSPFSNYSPKNDVLEKGATKSVDSLSITTENQESVHSERARLNLKEWKLYAPGQPLKTTPRIKIAQIHLQGETVNFIFEILSDVRWFVVKGLKTLKDLTKKINKDVMVSYEPEKIRLRKELVEIYVNSELSRDIDKMQLFILTGVVSDYAVRTEYLLVKDKEWIVVRGKVLNKSLVLYFGKAVYKILCLENAKPEILNETMFGINSRGTSLCFNTFSTAERDAWMEYLAV